MVAVDAALFGHLAFCHIMVSKLLSISALQSLVPVQGQLLPLSQSLARIQVVGVHLFACPSFIQGICHIVNTFLLGYRGVSNLLDSETDRLARIMKYAIGIGSWNNKVFCA